MYKELGIAVVIVVMIIALDVSTQKYTNKVIDEMIEELSEIKEDMRNSGDNNNDVVSKADDLYEKWLDNHDKLAYFIEHDELEKVETNFVSAKSYIKSKQYDLADSELEKTIFVLEHISDKYEFNLENIF